MSNDSTNISVPIKGMNQDVHPANLTEQGYDFALNSVAEEFTGNGFPLLQNESSTLPCVNFPDGYQVIGFVNVIEQDRKILFLVNPTTGFSAIGEIIGKTDCDDKLTDNDTELGYCDSCGGAHSPESNPLELQNITGCCEYLPIATQTCFNFNMDNPIRVVYRLEECGISLYFTDNRNPYRHIEFEYTDDDASKPLKVKDKFKVITGYSVECNEPIYGSQIDCNKLLIDPVLQVPCLELVDVLTGGDLKAGVYQFLISYADEDGGKRTPYFYATNPIPVFTRYTTFDTDYRTDRAIQVKVNNITIVSPYEYYNIAVAKTINNVTSFEFVGTYPIANKTVTYTGNEKSLKDLAPTDIFEQKVYYGKAKTVASSNDYLFWAGLEETKKLNVQRIANKVKLQWQTVAIPEPVYRNPRYTNLYRGYMRDEVYAFGLVLLYDNGEESAVGHIPGRAATASDIEVIDNDDVIDDPSCAEVSRNKKWQVYNTASVTGSTGACFTPTPPSAFDVSGSFALECIGHDNCSEQGTARLVFTLTKALTTPLTLQYAACFDSLTGNNAKSCYGCTDLLIPEGAVPAGYDCFATNNPSFTITIPAGVTSYTTPLLLAPGPGYNYAINCQPCMWTYTKHIMKVTSTNVLLNFTAPAGSIFTQVDAPEDETEDPTEEPDDCGCEEVATCQYGEFAYWESTERYPNNPEIWDDLCNKPIRHHKFPDSLVTHIHDGLDASRTFFNTNVVYPLGVRVNHQSVLDAINLAVTNGVITEEDRARIKGYRIVRANRFGHKSVIAKGLIYDVWNYDKGGQKYYYPNYPYNDLRSDPYLTEDASTYDDHDDREGDDLSFEKTRRYTFHSPDTHFNSPELGEEIKLEAEEVGKSEGYFNHAEEQAQQKMLSTTSYVIALSAGLVAMLTLINEVKEHQYTVRGVDASAMGVAAGTYGPTIVPPPTTLFNNATGIPLPALPGVSTVTKTSKQGTKEQMTGFSAPITGTLLDPVLGGAIGAFSMLNAISYKLGVVLHETQLFVNLIKTFTPRLNYAVQYNSVGKYNAYKNVGNSGFKRRRIETYSYLKPEMSLINEDINTVTGAGSNIFFNNWHRESSVYLKTDEDKSMFNNPTTVDNSRFIIGCRGDSDCDFKNYDKVRYYKDLSAYYASVKRYVSDQYGTISNIEYIDTGHCIFFRTGSVPGSCDSIYGGDTFISRFALKRKHSFFLQTRFGHQHETDVLYSKLHNVAYPRYYFDTTVGAASEIANEGILDLITDPATALGRPKSYLDAKTNKFFYQNGRMYLYNYGIPHFLVESDINCDYRYAENNKERDFYPNNSDLDFWLQEKNVSPAEDNHYFYNNTYSKQNKEHSYWQYPEMFEPGRMCRVAHPNRIIYSNGTQWLTYKANDFYDFPLSNGKLVAVNGIENDKVLVRSENTTQVFNAYVTIPTSTQTIQIGTGGMFKSKPQEYAHTTLGYAGSQHNCIVSTEYGHVWIDAKRGQVFNLNGNGLDEISKDGMKNWFKENLPFQVLKDFPNLTPEELDNNFKGIGITMAYDKRFHRLLITKLDYKKIAEDVVYDSLAKRFTTTLEDEPVEVDFTDPKKFCNRSWTISYNFHLKAWTSFHSYTPNYYIEGIDYFASGLNGTNSTLWLHNVTNKSYQVFYGKVTPWTIQTISKTDISKNSLNALEFGLDAIRYHNDYDPFYTNHITFNKAVVFNQNQNSGLLNLDFNTKSDLIELMTYPVVNVDSTTIRITNADGIWRFNQFYDISQSRNNNIPLWLNNCANSDKILNKLALDYQMADLEKRRIRGEYCRVRLTNDIHTRYKMIFKWMVNKSVKNFR
jgi:hypothetical protein